MKHEDPQGQQPDSSQASCQGDAHIPAQRREPAGQPCAQESTGGSEARTVAKGHTRYKFKRHVRFQKPCLDGWLLRIHRGLDQFSRIPQKKIDNGLRVLLVCATNSHTLMNLRESLLTEWARLKQDTAAIETLLSSRGWMPGSETDADIIGLSYIGEARDFVSKMGLNHSLFNSGGDFTSNDFTEFLTKKHGKDNINEASARGVFRVLESEGLIITKTPSRGRVGAIYSVVLNPVSVDKPSPPRKDWS
jgi:hypothetical protein